MNTLMPKTVSVSDIQKDYRRIFDSAKKTKKPIIVLSNNKPDVVIMDVKALELLNKKLEELEIEDTLRAVEEGRREYAEGKAIKAEKLFKKDPFSKELKTHKLEGNLQGLWAFSINYKGRVIFEFMGKGKVLFHKIGSHDIYK